MKQHQTPSSLLLLFGATGDLARRKLYPSLYQLYTKGLLSEQWAIVGVARRLKSEDEYKNLVIDSILTYTKNVNQDELDQFISHVYYQSHDVTNLDSYKQLKVLVDDLDEKYSLQGNRIFYLAMSPEFFGTVAKNIQLSGLKDTRGFNRLIIEKPFGRDLQSAIQLNNEIRTAFSEAAVFTFAQRDGAKYRSDPLFQRHLRTPLEQPLHRQYPDYIERNRRG